MHEPWTDESAMIPTSESLVEVLRPWLLLALALGCFLLDQAVLLVAWSAGALRPGLVVASLLGVVVPVGVTCWILGLPFRRGLALRRPSIAEVMLAVWVALSALAPVYALGVLGTRWFPPGEDAYQFYEALLPHDSATLLLGGLGVVVLAPLAEEILFRLLIQGSLLRLFSPSGAILTTALVFAAIHASWWILLPIAFLGLLLGVLMWRTANLANTWMVHGLFNLVAYWDLCLTRDVRATRLEGWSLDPRILGPSIGSLLAAVWVLWRWRRTAPAAVRGAGELPKR